MNIYEELRQQHGSDFVVALSLFDGDGDASAYEICEKYQQSYDAGEYQDHPFVLLCGEAPEDAAKREAYNEIKAEILRRWLSRIPRESMLATLETLNKLPCCTVHWLNGEKISVSLLMQSWNDANPTQAPIYMVNDIG